MIVLVVAIVSVGLWWLLQSTDADPKRAPQAWAPIKTDAPKQIASPHIEKPAAPPARAKSEMITLASNFPSNHIPATSNLAATENPQRSLDTAISDIVTLLANGDTDAVVKNYSPPWSVAGNSPEGQAAMMQYAKSPAGQQAAKSMLESFIAIENTTPTYDATGVSATFKLGQAYIVWVKYNDLWYFDHFSTAPVSDIGPVDKTVQKFIEPQ